MEREVWCWRGGGEQKRQCIHQEKETDAFSCFEQKETKRFLYGWRAIPDIWIFTFPLVFVTAIVVLSLLSSPLVLSWKLDASRVGWHCHRRECRITGQCLIYARWQVLQHEFCIQNFIDLRIIRRFYSLSDSLLAKVSCGIC